MSKTCADCSLRNDDEIDDGHCYIWRVWPDEKICSNFIPAQRESDNQAIANDAKNRRI